MAEPMDLDDLFEGGYDFISFSPCDGEEAHWIRLPEGWVLYENREPTEGPVDSARLAQWLATWLLARSEHGE